MQCKVVFQSSDISVQLHITSDEHKHERVDVEEHLDKLTWRTQPEAENIANCLTATSYVIEKVYHRLMSKYD